MTATPPREEIEKELLRAEKSLHAAQLLLKEQLLEDCLSRDLLRHFACGTGRTLGTRCERCLPSGRTETLRPAPHQVGQASLALGPDSCGRTRRPHASRL